MFRFKTPNWLWHYEKSLYSLYSRGPIFDMPNQNRKRPNTVIAQNNYRCSMILALITFLDYNDSYTYWQVFNAWELWGLKRCVSFFIIKVLSSSYGTFLKAILSTNKNHSFGPWLNPDIFLLVFIYWFTTLRLSLFKTWILQ